MTSASLDKLLERAQVADPATRIELRDSIAEYGETAVEAMADWLGDERLAAFAIRVLERIGQNSGARDGVVEVLVAVDRDELPSHLSRDIDRTLSALGRPKAPGHARPRALLNTRPAGISGVSGRGYWVMRTSPWERAYIWAESQHGRLRQGWGWNAEMNLDLIAEVVRRGGDLSDEQRMSWRSRRMRTAATGGIRSGDVIVVPNIPEWGRISVFRVAGSYEYALDAPRRFDERFGHILPVELIAADLDRRSPKVSEGLRAMLRVQTRLYNISGYGGDVERLVGNDIAPTSATDRWGELWTDGDYEVLFGRFAPTGPRPSDDQIDALAAELGRTHDAISWQWGDGASYCGGRSASTSSEPLKSWLDRRGLCP